MARYIEYEALLEQMDDTCKYAKPTNDYQRGCNEAFDWCVKIMKNMPTADVVPKCEVDLYRKQVDELEDELASTYDKLENAKADAAKEIFEEIDNAMSDNFHVDCRIGYYIEDYYDVDLRDDIAELKKKYTEQKNG